MEDVSDGSTLSEAPSSPEKPVSSSPEVSVRRSRGKAALSSVDESPPPGRRSSRSRPAAPDSEPRVLGRFAPITRSSTRASTAAANAPGLMGPPLVPNRVARSRSKSIVPNAYRGSPIDQHDTRSTQMFVTKANSANKRWDDWLPQDRLRKLTDDNRELASDLRREAQASEKPKTPKTATFPRKRAQDSEFGSGRGSEDPYGAGPAGKGGKRGRDNDIEKVGPSPTSSKRSRKAVFTMTMTGSPDEGDQDAAIDHEADTPGPSFKLHNAPKASRAGRVPTYPEFGAAYVPSTPGDSVFLPKSEIITPSDPAAAFPSSVPATITSEDYEVRRSTRTRHQVPVQYFSEKGSKPAAPPIPKKPDPSKGGVPLLAKRIIHGVYDEDGVYYPGKQILTVHAYYKFGFHCPDLESATKDKMERMLADAKKGPSLVSAEQRAAIKKEKEVLDIGIDAMLARGISQITINALRTPLPYEEPEYMLKSTAITNFHWAPIGPHTIHEKNLILKEAAELGVLEESSASASEPKESVVDGEPLVFSAPGSGKWNDILKFPHRLHEVRPEVLAAVPQATLKALPPGVLRSFPEAALRLLPPMFLFKNKVPIPLPLDDEDDEDDDEADEANNHL